MQLFRQSLAALFAEEVIAVFRQFGGGEPGHVFNQTQDGDVYLLAGEHADAFAGVGEGHLLRRGHHDGACVCTMVRWMSLVPGGRSMRK